MELGLNLSFAVKRWQEPEILAKIIKEKLGVDRVQFSWDLVNPWWPEELRDSILREYRKAFEHYEISLDGSFGGLAAYTYPQLLAANPYQREISKQFFRRAIDLTAVLGARVMGTPLGGMSDLESKDPVLRKARYQDALDSLKMLAAYGAERGLEEIQIEATPLITEFPHSPDVSNQLIDDLGVTPIPVKLLIDWGHALYKPLLNDEADIKLWFQRCKHNIGAIHLQQTDGLLDRHWDFTHEGLVDLKLIDEATKECGLDDVVQYLEVVYPFELSNEQVLNQMEQSFDLLKALEK